MPTLKGRLAPDSHGVDLTATVKITVEYVDPGQMFVADYGRPLKPARRQQLNGMQYVPEWAGAVWVSKRQDGRYALMDGQGRKHLAQRAGAKAMLALVYDGLTYEEEAELFLAANALRVDTTPVDEFVAAVEADEPTSTDINLILAKHGLRVAYGTGAHEVQAVRAMVNILQSPDMGAEVLDTVLSIATAAWGQTPHQQKGYQATIMQGLAQFHIRYVGQYKRKELISRLSATTPSKIGANAELIHQASEGHKYTAGRDRGAAPVQQEPHDQASARVAKGASLVLGQRERGCLSQCCRCGKTKRAPCGVATTPRSWPRWLPLGCASI